MPEKQSYMLTIKERRAKFKAKVEEVAAAMVVGTSCLDCEHFRERKELCVLYNQRPPVRVLVNGCPSFSENIPF